MPTLVRQGRTGEGIEKGPRRSPPLRSTRRRIALISSMAVSAAAVAAVLGISLANADNRVAQLQGAIGETAHTAVVAALETPGHRVANLEDSHQIELAKFVLLPNGQGYLVRTTLRALPSTDTYQLWGVVDGRAISLGLLGRAPQTVTFTLAGDPRPSGLGITVEPAGGSPSPSGPMLASGTV